MHNNSKKHNVHTNNGDWGCSVEVSEHTVQ